MKKDNSNLFMYLAVAVIIIAGGVAIALLSPQEPDRRTREEKTLAENIQDHDDLNTFAAKLEEAGLMETLNNPDVTYTVFAPVDAAFEDMKEVKGDKLTKLLSRHILLGEYDAGDIEDEKTLESIDGQTIKVKLREEGEEETAIEVLSVNGSDLFRQDAPNSNGVLHTVGAVL